MRWSERIGAETSRRTTVIKTERGEVEVALEGDEGGQFTYLSSCWETISTKINSETFFNFSCYGTGR